MVSLDATGRPPPFLSFGPSTYIFIIPLYCLLLSEEYNFIKVDAMAPTRNNSFAFNSVNYASLLTARTSMTSFRNCHYLRWNWGLPSLWCDWTCPRVSLQIYQWGLVLYIYQCHNDVGSIAQNLIWYLHFYSKIIDWYAVQSCALLHWSSLSNKFILSTNATSAPSTTPPMK